MGDTRKLLHPRGPHLGARDSCALCHAAQTLGNPIQNFNFLGYMARSFSTLKGLAGGKKKSKPSFEIKFPVYLQYIRTEIQKGKGIGNELFSCAPVNPRPPRPTPLALLA